MMEDNGAHFFEGTEKLLEVWFSRQDETKGTGDLRTIPRFVSFDFPAALSVFGSTLKRWRKRRPHARVPFPLAVRQILTS